MPPAGELSWLCRLVEVSFCSYTESEAFNSMCRQKEKEILLASSQVVRNIQLRIRGFDSRAEDSTEKPDPNHEALCGSNKHSSVHQCLPEIVAKMMVLLTVKSEFVHHVAVNALVLTSQFLSTTGNDWYGFINLLCRSLEIAISRMLSSSSAHSSGAENRGFDLSEFDFLIQDGLRNCDWSTVAGVTQVLRIISKSLKEEEYDNKSVKVYYDSVNSWLSKFPWDLLDECWSRDTGGSNKSSSVNQLGLDDFIVMKPGIKFLGTFLQLLCSLVDHNGFVETDCDSTCKHPLLVTVSNLIPRLVKWCPGKQEDRAEACIIHYLKHKLLILMIRLGLLIGLDCSIRLSWLELLHNYFQDFLQKPLSCFQSDQDDCLEGSPFLLTLSDGGSCGMHSCHLQRQAVFLFLDCSFGLMCQRRANADSCNLPTLCSRFTMNPDLELDRFCKRKGSLEVYKWVQLHLPTEMSVDREKYLAICMKFMSSFLQLYLREDDLLFEVLLQLLSITSHLQQQFETKEAAYQDVKKDFPFDLADIFNPVHLFHLFLSEIRYDHQVLLDYLISKDTGISCAKYLLRCLRLVCNSWKLFLEVPIFEEIFNQSSCKRRKLSGDGIDFLADGIPFSVDNNGSITLHMKSFEKHSEYGFKHYNIKPFKKAAECLLSLNNSIEKLYQKDLFPYNPEVLLKRLKRFQEFCCQEKGFHGQKTNYPNCMKVVRRG